MRREVTLAFTQRSSSGRTVNELDLRTSGALGRFPRQAVIQFWHQSDEPIPEPVVLDGYMLGLLMFPMQWADRFVVEGPLSAKALRHAHLLGEAWHCWLPSQYRPIDVIPDTLLSEDELTSARAQNPREGKAIAAFSGGADSTFLALRHAGRLLGDSAYPVSDVLMVHGFDVRPENQSDFDELRSRTQPLIESLGVSVRVVKTDIKTQSNQAWGHSFAAQLSSVLHQFSHEFEYGLIAGGKPYDHLLNAWGSTPSTDYLLSGGDFEIVHEGAGYSRTQKVELIATDPVARRALKVCWEGAQQGRNCGACEKCVRTRLNFMAVGHPDPECFDAPFDSACIDRLTVSSEVQLIELLTIVEYADQRGLKGHWLSMLRDRVDELGRQIGSSQSGRKPAARNTVRRVGSALRRRVKNLR